MAINKTGKDCCGCTACEAVCPKDAISMVPDAMGFKYPKVDYDKCIECGLCEKTCSFTESYKTPDNFDLPIPYGARLKDIGQLMKSRSGGAFMAFSDWILEKGGVIYGCGYKGHFIAAHKRAVSPIQRDEFRGSKYVQSSLEGVFRSVKQDLQQGLWVLFSGTACQTSGLSSYLPDKLKERLVILDIVCHSVPSPKIWESYLNYVEEKEKMNVIGVDFRDKKNFGWSAHKETLTLQNLNTGKEKTLSTDTFAFLFHINIMLRPSCGDCKFCNLRRPSDLTLADFWGWQKTDKKINEDDRGISLVLVNTPKGKKIFEETQHLFNTIEPKLADCMQAHLKHPSIPSPLSDQFKTDFETKGFEFVLKKYGNVGVRHKVKSAVGLLKRIPSAIIKKIR